MLIKKRTTVEECPIEEGEGRGRKVVAGISAELRLERRRTPSKLVGRLDNGTICFFSRDEYQ
jgi:hypothetical protein